MKILVIDKYNYPRDLAQMDMYKALNKHFEIEYATSQNLINLIQEDDYDYLYLGIYHPWCGKIDWDLLFKLNKKPILIDQADNEGFTARVNSKFQYKGNYILLSRYLPNKKLEDYWKDKLYLLPWYIDPYRFIPDEKTIDMSFVCTININRIGRDRKKMSEDILKYCQENELKHVIGEYYFDNYIKIITKSKTMVVDGSRNCLTQKYIEAALSNCLIIGEKPESPPNNFITISLESYDKSNNYNDIIEFNRKYALENFANDEKFLKTFKDIISNF